MARRHWYYQKPDGTRHGPFSSGRMRKLARRGHLAPRDRVWKAGSSSTFLAADFPQLYLRVATHKTRVHLLKTFSAMGAGLLATAVTNPWSDLSLALPPAARPWLTVLCIASLAAAFIVGGIGFLKLDDTFMMVPPESTGRRHA